MALRLSGMISGMDTESMVAELMAAQRLKATKIENRITTTEWKKEKWKELNTKLYSLYTGSLSKMKMQGSYNTKEVSSSDASKVTVTASNSATEGTHLLKVNQLASAQFVTGANLASEVTSNTTLSSLGIGEGDITVTNGTNSKTLTVSSDMTVNDLVATLKDAGLNASFDSAQKRFYISSQESGTDSAFSLSSTGTIDLSKVGLKEFTSADSDASVSLTGGGTMSFMSAKDALFEYNGASMTSSSNNVTANGLTFNLLGKTGVGESISLNITNNTKAVYDMVKDFVKGYNEILTEMNKFYYAASAKGFDPLTDEEKEAMSEDQIEKWETKIKDSLLRRDSTMSSILGTLRDGMGQSVSYNNKSYALSSFGIVSGNYTEKGLLHIKGDEDDSTVTGLNNDLMAALAEDPEAVMQTLTQVTGKLYGTLTKSMSSSSLSSALTFYNDKELTKQVTKYEEDLSKLEDKLADIESRYYKQFTAMEKAMSKLNSQSSYLTSMLGTGNQ